MSNRLGILAGSARLLLGVGVANHSELRIRAALQLQGDIVKASLGFVVDPCRTLLIPLEADRAERARQRSRRRRRRVDRNSRRAEAV